MFQFLIISDYYNFHNYKKILTAIWKGVQSINNCWGGEGPVFNPDYMCGAQYMITQGKDHNYFFVLIEIYFYDSKFFMILIRHSWKKMWNFLFAYWTGAFQASVRIRRFVFDLRRVRSLCCWQIFDHWFLRANSGNIKKYKCLIKPYDTDFFNFCRHQLMVQVTVIRQKVTVTTATVMVTTAAATALSHLCQLISNLRCLTVSFES